MPHTCQVGDRVRSVRGLSQQRFFSVAFVAQPGETNCLHHAKGIKDIIVHTDVMSPATPFGYQPKAPGYTFWMSAESAGYTFWISAESAWTSTASAVESISHRNSTLRCRLAWLTPWASGRAQLRLSYRASVRETRSANHGFPRPLLSVRSVRVCSYPLHLCLPRFLVRDNAGGRFTEILSVHDCAECAP